MYLLRIVRPHSEGNTVTSVHQLGLIFPGETVSSGLLSLTVGSSLPQTEEILRHSDGLDICQSIVALPVQNYRGRV